MLISQWHKGLFRISPVPKWMERKAAQSPRGRAEDLIQQRNYQGRYDIGRINGNVASRHWLARHPTESRNIIEYFTSIWFLMWAPRFNPDNLGWCNCDIEQLHLRSVASMDGILLGLSQTRFPNWLLIPMLRQYKAMFSHFQRFHERKHDHLPLILFPSLHSKGWKNIFISF